MNGSRCRGATSILVAVLLAFAGLTLAPRPSLAQELEAGADRQTGVRGRVLDRRTNKPLANAPVVVTGGGQARNTLTDERGVYHFFLPPGSYVVRSYFDMYHGARYSGVTVTRGELLEVSFTLARIDEDRDVDVEEVEIPYRADTTTAAAQDQLRQASSGIGEGLGAKQMSQVGASDAGAAAARVVGVTIESSQLVVRGLGGRYNRVLLNGIPVPSTDPDSPGVDLDMFPTGVIDSLSLTKAFSPDMPADFAGGVLEIKSVQFPRKFTLELEVATGMNSETTFRKRVDYDGGRYDAFGFDDGRRKLPSAIPADEPLRANPNGRFKTRPDLDAPAEAFRDKWQYERRGTLPNLGLEATLGDSRRLSGNKRIGYLATASYDHGTVRRVGVSRPNPTLDTANGSLKDRNRYTVENGSEEVQLTALGTASLDLGLDHAITALTLYNRSVSDETSFVRGVNVSEQPLNSLDYNYQKWQLDFLSRTLWFNQIFGDHRNLFGTRLRFRWAGFQAYGNRDEPDRRSVAERGKESPGTTPIFNWIEASASGERFFSQLEQNDLGGTAGLRFPLWAEGWGNLGGWVQRSGRAFKVRRFRMLHHPDGVTMGNYNQPVEALFSPEGIGTLTRMEEETQDADSYESTQLQYAAHLLLETPLFGPLSFAGGLRAEILEQEVISRSPFRPDLVTGSKETRTDRTDTDYLPGGALKYQASRRTVFRAAYGMTVSRPQIRELAPFQFYDFIRERNIEGEPDLKRALIHNADLRWEWFFGDGEIAAASLFYKKFINPIELQIKDPESGNSQYINAEGAWNVGGELELRLALARLSRRLRWFNLDSNLALIRSRVELPPDTFAAVASSRRLFGQAPYVLNLSLRFHEDRRDVTAALVYNVVGPRITDAGVAVTTAAGTQYFPDVEERPFHSLDFVASAQVWRHVKLKLKVKNILLQHEELRQGDHLIRTKEPGLSASAGVVVSY
jgi:hypothetical protein